MNKSLTLGKKLGFGFGAMAVITAAIVLASLLSVRKVGETFDSATRNETRKLDLAHSIATGAAQMLSFQRAVLVRAYKHDLTVAAQYQSSFDDEARKDKAYLDQLRPLLVT
ncbi:MAG: hypothetical protein LAO79_00890 [Acidobacteriia bacterium]|nr:hypothetical protein [Terriglobia bacterium]